MSTERRQQLERAIREHEDEVREMEKTLDQKWWRNLVHEGQEMAGGHFDALVSGPIDSIASVVQHFELRGQIRGIALYGSLITGRLDTLKQTLKQLIQEYDREPEDADSSGA